MSNRKWTIQIDYMARNDDGKQFRARSCFQCEAPSIPAAYAIAEAADWSGHEPVKFGCILEGWHIMKL